MPRSDGEKSSAFPNKEARYNCWNARDNFWECLDSGGNVESCKEERKLYEESCPATWVKHFDRKKNYLAFKEKLKEGYDPIDQNEKCKET
ncbi:cytochrome c oxidase assembly factor 6 homolog [Oratosquilla oratoria]|uniref:cytochrome c oxidase assembly factor 6 homolog n=1 Tax=Oratosquilla oratoria TaxID=337810 RepID=UPI003F758246